MADDARTVTEYLTRDHRRLHALAGEAARSLASGALAEAAAHLDAFARGLERHMEMEERILFPAVEAKMGTPGAGPTVVMRAEHDGLRRVLATLRAAVAASDAVALRGALREIEALLGRHDAKEERILYPLSDRLLADETARVELLRRLRELERVS